MDRIQRTAKQSTVLPRVACVHSLARKTPGTPDPFAGDKSKLGETHKGLCDFLLVFPPRLGGRCTAECPQVALLLLCRLQLDPLGVRKKEGFDALRTQRRGTPRVSLKSVYGKAGRQAPQRKRTCNSRIRCWRSADAVREFEFR